MVEQRNIKNLAKTIHTQKKSVGSFFSQASTAQEFMTTLSQKSYYENYSLLYYTTIFFALISQLATAVSSYTFFADLLAIKVSPLLLPFAVATLLLLIEVLKYVSFNKGLEGVFALPQRINYALLVFAALLCAASMYASITGGGSFGIDTQKLSNTETKFDSEIATLRTEIAEIHKRNTWKGNVWLPKKEKALLYQKEQELAQAKLDKENGLKSVLQDNEIAATQYQFGFAFFDTLFILCTLYVWYFRKQVAIEAMVEQTSVNSYQGSVISHQPVSTYQVANQNQVTKPPHRKTDYLKNTPLIFEVQKRSAKKDIDNENRIDNDDYSQENKLHDENSNNENRPQMIGVRICLHCKDEYVANHRKQKFCEGKGCRQKAWEEKKNRPLIFKKKKVAPTNVIKPVDLFS